MVYDGGGVSPDVEVDRKNYSEIVKAIATKGYFFEYANKYRAEHPSIPPAKQFKLTDADYQKFVAFLENKDVSYTTKVERELTELTEQAKEGKHLEDIKGELDAIKKKVSHNKSNDLMRFRSEIQEMLEAEIASRYYLQKGYIESSFDDDPDILMAKRVLNEPQQYASYLKTK